ncbi:MAG: RrF2 family transcriptional regulator [Pseudobdellovibrionaceae bacterium]
MNKLNRKMEYALMALKFMSHKIPGELTTAKEISEALKVPFDATARVLQQMAQSGLLRAEYGAFGGYQIVRDLAKTTVNDLIEIIEGPVAIVKCMHVKEDCEVSDQCNILSPVHTLNRKLVDLYKSMNLKELLLDRPTAPVKQEAQHV